jgi:hypothetical protein
MIHVSSRLQSLSHLLRAHQVIPLKLFRCTLQIEPENLIFVEQFGNQ